MGSEERGREEASFVRGSSQRLRSESMASEGMVATGPSPWTAPESAAASEALAPPHEVCPTMATTSTGGRKGEHELE